MDDGIQIFIYIIAFAIWIFSAIQKVKKKSEKAKPVVFTPASEEDFSVKEQELLKPIVEDVFIQKEKVEQTTFGKTSYRESLEYKEKIKARKMKNDDVPQEEKNYNPVIGRINEIDWRQAIIHSEILSPRF